MKRMEDWGMGLFRMTQKNIKAIFAHHPQKTAFTIEAIMMVPLNTHVAASIFYRVKNIKKRANYIQKI